MVWLWQIIKSIAGKIETFIPKLVLVYHYFIVSLNQQTVGEMLQLAKNYDKALEDEEKMTPEQLAIKNVGKLDPKRHLEEKVDVLMTNNVVQLLGAMLDTIVFK